jgi:ferredoxin-nitrite reductase
MLLISSLKDIHVTWHRVIKMPDLTSHMSGFKYSDIHKIIYPRRHEGIYKNRGDNPWVSVRIRQGVGRDPSKWFTDQLRTLAEVSRRYGDGRVMLGTRGDVEIFKVDYRLFDEVVSRLKAVNLDPRDSCGNSVRNPIPCPSNHCLLAQVNAEALSKFVGDYFRYKAEYEGPSAMPHRFKISISACERACAIPVAQDVGIVAKGRDTFDVYVGGGIGEHAFSAKLMFSGVKAEDLLPIIVGAIEVFKREGERRGFKWVVAKYGIDRVRSMILDVAGKVKQTLPAPPDLSPRFINTRLIKLHYPTGWVESSELERIADIADKHGLGYVILFNNQTIYVPVRVMSGELKDIEVKDPGPFSTEGPTTVACIGSELCPPGLIDTTSLGSRIHIHLKGTNRPIRIGISGCTHDCGMSWVSDIGLEPYGFKTRILITLGGGPTELGYVVGTIDPMDAEQAVDLILNMYVESNSQSITEFISRVGVDKVREVLAMRIPSFKAPDKSISSVFGPN